VYGPCAGARVLSQVSGSGSSSGGVRLALRGSDPACGSADPIVPRPGTLASWPIKSVPAQPLCRSGLNVLLRSADRHELKGTGGDKSPPLGGRYRNSDPVCASSPSDGSNYLPPSATLRHSPRRDISSLKLKLSLGQANLRIYARSQCRSRADRASQ
jgi:hypothetical protein